MFSRSDLFLTVWCSLFISFLTYTALPLISWCFLLISFITHTVLYSSSFDAISSSTATRNDGEAKGCTFLWKIENLSYCRLKKGEYIKSPTFTANSLYGTVWLLHLFPKGVKNDSLVTVVLKRGNDHYGPNVIEVKYQIEFLDKDGSVLEEKLICENDFQRENSVFFYVRENVSGSERKSLLLEDNLTVRCQLWKKDEEPIMSELLSAQTVFKMHRGFFVWRINEFPTLSPDPRSKVAVIDKLTDGVINLKLVLYEDSGSKTKLDIDIRSFDECVNLFSFKVSIIDSKGIKVDCGYHEYREGNLRKGKIFPLSYGMIRNEKSKYLPNDVLSLDCEYVYSFVTSSNECARCGSFASLVTEETAKNTNISNIEKHKSGLSSVLVNDLKFLYSNAILCDTEFRTSTQRFPAHKAILSARSTVFRRMFSSDMKEKNSGHVDITDFDDETVQRMLKYIYTDSFEDMQLESASKLYTAADKYDIPSLKHRCASFLKYNLCPSTSCDVLVLADRHQDHDLENAVKNYILAHDKEVFDTQEWKHFMNTNLQLAADMMYQKVTQSRL